MLSRKLFFFFSFLLGCIFGSFYNLLIHRLSLNMASVKRRCVCTNYCHRLSIIDLIPIFSYVALGGKCRYCGEKISISYPLIELVTGLLFLIAFSIFSVRFQFIYMTLFWSMLLITSVIDIYEGYVYDELLLYFLIAILFIRVFLLKNSFKEVIISGLVGYLIYYVVYFITKIYYKKEAFGLGDVHLMASIGLSLDIKLTIMSALLSFVTALIFLGGFHLFSKNFELNQEVPFTPFMCVTAFFLSIYGEKIFNLYINLLFS